MERHEREHANRPGRVTSIVGVIFQNDAGSTIGRWFIHPLEAIDRQLAGLGAPANSANLAMHAGLHVVLEDGRELVVEQLAGSLVMNFVSGLSWTPIERFRQRDRGGWDVTVPATVFRGVDEARVAYAVENLNRIEGNPFFGEDCTAFVERSFGDCRLFADSPFLRSLGVGVRIGDPALPLIKPESRMEPRAERLLRADTLRKLPGALAHPGSLNWHLWLPRGLTVVTLGIAVGLLVARVREKF